MDKEPLRRCYISYKKEDFKYKDRIVKKFANIEFIDNSQKEFIDSVNPDTIIQTIKEKYLDKSTVTIFLIGTRSYENYQDESDKKKGYDSQIIIRREITASLYNGNGNKRSGLLGVVLPEMYEKIYGQSVICNCCGQKVDIVNINNNTVIKEFAQNFYLKKHGNPKCDHYSEDDRYAVLVRYSDFMNNPEKYIDQAFEKRTQPIANEVRVRKFD